MGNASNFFEVGNVNSRVTEAFNVNQLSLIRNCGFKAVQLVGIKEACRNADMFECFRKEFYRTAVEGRSRHDFISGTGYIENSQRNSRRAAGRCQSGCAAFQCGNTFFKDLLSRVSQTGINVTRLTECELIFTVLSILKNIRSCLINGDGAGPCYGIGNLACMLL